MSITSEIQKLETNLGNCYDAVFNKGGTISQQNFDSLATAIASIPSGGGSIETESGTFQPNEDVQKPWIAFSNQHTTAPRFIVLIQGDENGAGLGEPLIWTYIDVEKITGNYFKRVTSQGVSDVYVVISNTYQRQATSSSMASGYCTVSSDDEGSSIPAYPKYFATNQGFYGGIAGSSTSSYATFISGRKYKWKAYWI